MRQPPRRLVALAIGLGLAGCAPATSAPPVAGPAPVPPPAATAPAAPAPDPREALAAPHNTQSETLERSGDLQQALRERKIALTINPEDRAARAGRARLEKLIEGRVAERVQQGRAALARGSHVEARRHFLAALALDPTNRAVFDALKQEVRDVEVLVHTVRSGETMASLAQRYYGDSARAEVIAETNQVSPGVRLAAGRQLKIPEIPGLPFARPQPPRETARPAPRPDAAQPARPESAPPAREESPEVNPLLLDAQEAFSRNAHAEALTDLDRLLTSDPNNAEAQALRRRTVRVLVNEHYSQGLRLYRQEKLAEAVTQWRRVLELDPQHADARRNIEQAERLLKSLDERRRR
jgi:tetratricopeptide (TPR) repeat protein